MRKKSVILVLIILITLLVPIVEAKKDPILEKKVIVHRVKPDNPGKPPKSDPTKYWYKVSSLTWNNPSPNINYEINLAGSNLPDTAAYSIISCFETWDDTTSAELFANYNVAPLTTAQAGVKDEHNVLSFGPTDAGIIAVTTIWYNPSTGSIAEIDTLFNTYYQWTQSGTLEPQKMDLENIATHEIGHWLVLEDLYNKPASAVTMFGYSTYGETSKETLEMDDIIGVEAIYGP